MSIIVVNMTSIMFSTIICIIVLIFRVGLSKLFTSDSEVIEAVSHLTPLLAISVWLNGIQPILSGKQVPNMLAFRTTVTLQSFKFYALTPKRKYYLNDSYITTPFGST